MNDPADKTELTLIDVYTLYESGKNRRYGLLFAVNGGAFAILALLLKEHQPISIAAVAALMIAPAMIFFTWTMWWDIDAFGTKMAKLAEPTELYGPVGRKVLLSIIGMLIFAWTVLAFVALVISVCPRVRLIADISN
jgi:hypothetical protein